VSILWGLLSLHAQPRTIYVSTVGNDQWQGAQPEPAADGKEGPLATVGAAIVKARAIRATAAAKEPTITILVRGGIYELPEPIRLTPTDSGASEEQRLVLAAYPGERPVLSGGRRVSGWQPVPGKAGFWQAELPEVREGKWYFRQVFVNGRRKQRARTPSQGFFRIQGSSPQEKPARFKFQPGEIKKDWAALGDVEAIGFIAWADFRMQIRAVDETKRIVTLSGDTHPAIKEENARYYIENAPDGLDVPGEWYLDQKSGLLTLFVDPGEDIKRATVIAPRLTELMVLQGDAPAVKGVKHVTLRGLTFSYTDWELGDTGYGDAQAAVSIRGDLRAEGAVDLAIEECTFSHLAGYAIELGRGCQRNRIVGNEIVDIGGGGVRIGETSKREAAADQNHSQLVSDNDIHQLGRIYAQAIGVLILQSGTNRVAHNHIHDLYYTAVSVGWNWGYQETPCRENVIEYNHLHDIGQAMLSDMGAVYTLGIQKGTVIRNNLIHDVNSFTYGGWGLYPDEGSSEIVWEKNVVFRTKSAGFHQHYGRENLVRNNIFAFGREHQLMRTRPEPHVSFIFTNNIVYFNSGDLLGSNWSNDHYKMDYNLYFDARSAKGGKQITFAGATFDQWRERGHDRHSIIGDPLFVAPERDDFRLKPNSPALRLGFEAIDLSSVGVRKRADRTNR
jgi:hypothetical protein